MFKVKAKNYDNIYDVYAVDFGPRGPVTLLLYYNGQWVREKADQFEPYIEEVLVADSVHNVPYYNVIATVSYPGTTKADKRYMCVSIDELSLTPAYVAFVKHIQETGG